jgi:hypothetical protein
LLRALRALPLVLPALPLVPRALPPVLRALPLVLQALPPVLRALPLVLLLQARWLLLVLLPAAWRLRRPLLPPPGRAV